METEKNCPICFEEYSREKGIIKDSNLNHDKNSKCKHWFCNHCLKKMSDYSNYKCPICRKNILLLVDTHDKNKVQLKMMSAKSLEDSFRMFYDEIYDFLSENFSGREEEEVEDDFFSE